MNRRNFLLSTVLTSLHSKTPSLLRQLGNQAASDAESLRLKLMNDVLRPQYHLLPLAGFVGDPCAPRYYQGQYHVFFHGSYGGRGWQHGISPDLVHWRHMPIALSPTDGSYDGYGTFTGSVLPSVEGTSIIYTGTTKVPTEQETIRNEGIREVQCIATTNDSDLRTWHKLPQPVIEHPPEGMKVTGFRDPFSWKEGDTWYLGVGSGVSQVGGMVLLYRSKDARHWEYLHPLAQGVWNGQFFSNPVPSGEMWECPDFFALGDKHVLLYSTEGKAVWETGTFDRNELRFHSERKGVLDHGAYYAPKSMLDAKGRRILWGWVQETRSREETNAAGWSGCISLPRVLSVGQDNELQIQIAPEIDSLRRNTVEIKAPHSAAELDRALGGLALPGRAGEVSFTFHPGERSCGLQLEIGQGENASRLLSVIYQVDVTGARSVSVGDRSIPLGNDMTVVCEARLWIDGSVFELHLNSRHALTARSYGMPSDSGPLRMRWIGDPVTLRSFSASEMTPISTDRLTS